MFKFYIILVITAVLVILNGCNENTSNVLINPIDTTLKITFVELGSETCIPCKNMRPVMDSIQRKYGSQILVKYIDVIRNHKEAEPFKITLMPTQVFLDSVNKEIHRHEGFYSEDSIHIFLQSKGLKIIEK